MKTQSVFLSAFCFAGNRIRGKLGTRRIARSADADCVFPHPQGAERKSHERAVRCCCDSVFSGCFGLNPIETRFALASLEWRIQGGELRAHTHNERRKIEQIAVCRTRQSILKNCSIENPPLKKNSLHQKRIQEFRAAGPPGKPAHGPDTANKCRCWCIRTCAGTGFGSARNNLFRGSAQSIPSCLSRQPRPTRSWRRRSRVSGG